MKLKIVPLWTSHYIDSHAFQLEPKAIEVGQEITLTSGGVIQAVGLVVTMPTTATATTTEHRN